MRVFNPRSGRTRSVMYGGVKKAARRPDWIQLEPTDVVTPSCTGQRA